MDIRHGDSAKTETAIFRLRLTGKSAEEIAKEPNAPLDTVRETLSSIEQ